MQQVLVTKEQNKLLIIYKLKTFIKMTENTFQSKMEYTWGEKEKDTTQNNVYR